MANARLAASAKKRVVRARIMATSFVVEPE